MGMEVVALPLFEIVAVDWVRRAEGDHDALLLTSANAIAHGGAGIEALSGLPVAAVGAATAAAARARGLTVMIEGSGGVDDLLARLPGRLRLLHLAGEDRVVPAPAHHSIDTVTVYKAVPIGGIDFAAIEGAVVALHSPRAALCFVDLVDQAGCDRSSTAIAALSDAVAVAAGAGWQEVAVAAVATDAALLALARPLCLGSQA